MSYCTGHKYYIAKTIYDAVGIEVERTIVYKCRVCQDRFIEHTKELIDG